MAEEIAEGVPKPPLLAVTGRQNTMLEFDSMFQATDSQENQENNSGASAEDNQGANPWAPRQKFILDAKTKQVVQGSFKDLPQRPTSTVRIFLSSTFSGKDSEIQIYCPTLKIVIKF